MQDNLPNRVEREGAESSEESGHRKKPVGERASSVKSVPWPDKYIGRTQPSGAIIATVEAILKDAQDESSLQQFLARTPSLFRLLLPGATDAWCFDRPALGGEFIPDFLLCYHNSRGYNWVMVELESPTKPALTKAGRPSSKLTEAIGQVRDWRIWLRQNIAYAQGQLGFTQLDAECPALVIIGRRADVELAHALRYRELSSGSLSVMSYDRLLESVRHGQLEGTT